MSRYLVFITQENKIVMFMPPYNFFIFYSHKQKKEFLKNLWKSKEIQKAFDN